MHLAEILAYYAFTMCASCWPIKSLNAFY